MSVIDQYLEKINPAHRQQLERIRTIAKDAVPEAGEVMSYNMPTLHYRGKSFLGFDAHANHIGVYPYGGEEIEVFKDRLTSLGYGFSTGAIRVPFDQPIPEDLLKAIIRHRIGRIS